MKKIIKAAGIVAAAAALTLGFSGSALAGTDGPVASIPGSEVWFQAYGNVIYVHDTSCDGLSAVAEVQVPAAGIHDYLWNSSGCGGTDHYQYVGRFPEGTTVYYRPCVGVYSSHTVTNCSSTEYSGVA